MPIFFRVYFSIYYVLPITMKENFMKFENKIELILFFT